MYDNDERITRALNIYTNPDIDPESKERHLKWLMGRIGQPIHGEEPYIEGMTIPPVEVLRFKFTGVVKEILEKLGWEEMQRKVNKWRRQNGKRVGGRNPWTHRNEKFFLSALSRFTGISHNGEPVAVSGRINSETAKMFRDLLIEVRGE